MMDYYDFVLGLLPVTVGGVAGLLTTAGVELSLAVAVGSLVSLPLLAHALFVRAPVGTPEPRAEAAPQQGRATDGARDAVAPAGD
jgi:hypothetical protein